MEHGWHVCYRDQAGYGRSMDYRVNGAGRDETDDLDHGAIRR